jgi:4-alpha-glucanotransferase
MTGVDYEEVMRLKMAMLKELFDLMSKECFESEDYKKFFGDNRHWLVPYAAFSYFRDKYGSSHFDEWKTNSVYNKEEIDALISLKSAVQKEISFYFFIQYHLHLQLKDAADYVHKRGIILKGDIPIGIYRHGCDACQRESSANPAPRTRPRRAPRRRPSRPWSCPSRRKQA